MPYLTHLSIKPRLSGGHAQMLAAVRLGMLRSLDAHMDLSRAWFLQGCTQLKALTLCTYNFKGASAIAQLTGLTHLELGSGSYSQLFSAAEQSELGGALAALTNLQSLHLSHAPPGPVTQALSQLTGLTELCLARQDLVVDPGPLILPSCLQLNLSCGISTQQLACIEAPQLCHLGGMQLALKPSDLGALRRLCRGVLRACSGLCLSLQHEWSEEGTVALMAVLNQDWQPSAKALQPIRSSSIGNDRSNGRPRRQLSLHLWHAYLSRQCLELLPKGLGSIDLWWVPWLYPNTVCGSIALVSTVSFSTSCKQSQIHT
jgi:hypothetical protein